MRVTTLLQNGLSDSAAIGARFRKKRVYGKPRSRTERHRFNGRSREGVRVRMLQKQFRAEIGEEADNAGVALAIRNAAELTMLAEMQRAAMIRGEHVDLSNLLRLEGVSKRAVAFMRQLAREVREEARQPRQSIDQYLAEFRTARVQAQGARHPPARTRTAPSKRNATGGHARNAQGASRRASSLPDAKDNG
jgi:hypothetical protein